MLFVFKFQSLESVRKEISVLLYRNGMTFVGNKLDGEERTRRKEEGKII